MAKVKNEKSRNDVKVWHPSERYVNPEAGKLAINMDVQANSERTLIVLGQLSRVSYESFRNCRSVVMIKSCRPGMQITTSEETTPNKFVFQDALNACPE